MEELSSGEGNPGQSSFDAEGPEEQSSQNNKHAEGEDSNLEEHTDDGQQETNGGNKGKDARRGLRGIGSEEQFFRPRLSGGLAGSFFREQMSDGTMQDAGIEGLGQALGRRSWS